MKQADEEEKKEGVIRIVRKRWRGVAPYFYTVWPLLCIIPHLARSSRDAGSRYADPLLRAENPNLPSVSQFRRMMDDARDEEGPTEGLAPAVPFLQGKGGGKGYVLVDTTNEARARIFPLRVQNDLNSPMLLLTGTVDSKQTFLPEIASSCCATSTLLIFFFFFL